MKQTLIALMLAASLGGAAHAAVKDIDRIVAVVNKNVITERQLSARIQEVSANLKRQNVELPDEATLKHQVLEQMISEEVQLQYAQNNGITLADGDLDKAVQKLAEQNKLSVAGLEARLKKEGVALSQFREEIRREILLGRLKEREVDSRVNVTDTEVDQVVKSELSGKSRNEYRLATILVSVPERADSKVIEERGRRAQEALAALKAGKPFAQVAASYSDAKSALSGGDMGWRSAAGFPPNFVSLLENLKPGENTDLVRTQQGFVIFKLVDKRAQGAAQMVEQRRVRHILVRTNEAVSESDAKQRIDQIRDRIARGARFDEQARLYSEDASNSRGGELGWLSPGDTVPEFERAMLSLKLGELSAPVRSPFGWHLIEVEEKRTQDMSGEREKLAIKQQIRARKIEEAYLDWARQLRDSAFVEDRLIEK
ncbi:peptidylprolyl isomerase [Crenobacter cavernae]|uniref:Chaperone SurA n=1 Tax=Crenobacter cavernae TaxID=2290923 RepID=A0A345Y3Z9_9NEIS|nr:peptidylprolyl isomerase [Crenobacter cavernae]AXK38651.1 molecular chaperone SurA [Crenobacter cavernae]